MRGVAAAAIAALVAVLLVVGGAGSAAGDSPEDRGTDRGPLVLSADPGRLEISSCLPKTFDVGMESRSSEPFYADALISSEPPLEVSRGAISSYLPAGYKLQVPARVSVPTGTPEGEYEVLLAPRGERRRPSRSGQVVVPVAVVAPNNCMFEAESLLPPVEATAPASSQSNCCGVRWSGDAQLWFPANRADQRVTVAFEVPQAGTYDLSAVFSKAPDYGIHTLSVDGEVVGEPFDGYAAGGVSTQEVGYGALPLSAGRHSLTVTVTGKNAEATGYFAGVDVIELESLDQGR